MRCILFHSWGKWSEKIELTKKSFAFGMIYERDVDGQKRVCTKCGRIQYKEIAKA
jgi:hypothetical protein